jgi:glycosyltransferase involved in cell wall biosynthesis
VGAHRDGAVRTQEKALSSSYYAPEPGSRSGVADYAHPLLKALRRLGTWETPIYHLGNNRLHEAIYAQALRVPGVVVLHDAALHHFLLGTLSRDEYIAEFVYNYGEWRRHMAEELWAERASSGVDPKYFAYPMLRRVTERSRAIIVHNPGAASMARAHGASQVFIVPHYFEPANLPDSADAACFRQKIGVGQGTTLFGIFGYLRETKRVLPSIRAFCRLHAVRPDTALLLAGDTVSPDLERLLETEAAHPGIVRLRRLAERDFMTAAAALDCCLSLRYPGAGETSGITVRMMGMGKPVIVTASEENADIPATACLRVNPGIAEGAELLDHMVLVSEFPGIARQIGDTARHRIREHHSLDQVVRRYWQILCAITP